MIDHEAIGDKLLAAAGQASAAAADLIEELGGSWQRRDNVEDGSTTALLVDAVRLVIETVELPRIDELTAEFERDLMRRAEPRPSVGAIPLRMII